MPITLGASRVMASLRIIKAILAVFSRAHVIPTKIISNGVVTHEEVLFWEGAMASVDEIASGFEAIGLTSSVIMSRRSILEEQCSFVESPGVLRKREAFQ